MVPSSREITHSQDTRRRSKGNHRKCLSIRMVGMGRRFSLVYIRKKQQEETSIKTRFINPCLDSLEKQLSLLKEQEASIDALAKEKKPKIVMVNGDKYVVKGMEMSKAPESTHASKPKRKTTSVCLQFCKHGFCKNPECPNVHDTSLVRICPAFLRVLIHDEYNIGMLSERILHTQPHHESRIASAVFLLFGGTVLQRPL